MNNIQIENIIEKSTIWYQLWKNKNVVETLSEEISFVS